MLLCGAAPSMCLCRGGARGALSGAPLQLQARATRCSGRAMRRARGRPRLFSGPPLQTDRMRERRRVLLVGACRGVGASGVAPGGGLVIFALEPVYASNFRRGQSRGAAEYCVSWRAVASGLAVASLRLESHANCCETQGFRLFSSEEPAKHRIPSARRQRHARRHNPKPCSRQPCAAPPRKAAAC